MPETLLGVVVEEARRVVAGRDPSALGPALRPLTRVDRRAAESSTVRRQFVAALARDDEFAGEVAAAISARDDAAAALAGFDRAGVLAAVTRAADGAGLAVLVAALWAVAPDGWELGFGACAAVEHERRERWAIVAERDALAARVAAAERELADRLAAAADVAREHDALHAKVADERAARRAAEQRVVEGEAAIEQARADLDGARTAHGVRDAELRAVRDELARERSRVSELERALADARGAVSAAAERAAATVTADELAKLADAADALTRRLRTATSRATTAHASPQPAAAPAPAPKPTAPVARTKPRLPPGLVADSVDGARAMLSQGGATLVVDGYNVSHHAWPGTTVMLQRDRLERGLQQVHQRFGCPVVCCYDGDDTVGVSARRIPGVRIAFSASHEEADELVVDTVRSLPKRIPAVVASSDAWVRQHAEALGAVVVSAATATALMAAAGRR